MMPNQVFAKARESLAFLLVVAAMANGAVAEGIRWAPNLETAKQASAQFKVPVMIHFRGDNCLPCKTLEQRVLNQTQTIETLNKYFICVQVDATASQENLKIAASYNVHSWPTDVFLSPDGSTLFQGVCPGDLKNYIGVLQNVAIMNRDRNIMVAANTANQQQMQSNLQQNYASSQVPASMAGNTSGASVQTNGGWAGGAGPQTAAVNGYHPSQAGVPSQVAASSPTSNGPQAGLLPPPNQMGTYASAAQSSDARAATNYTAAPATSVISGPLSNAQQPTAVSHGVQQQISQSAMAMRSAAIQQSLQQESGSLPPRSTVGLVTEPASSKAGTAMIPPEIVSSMPTMTSNRASMPAVTPTIQQASTPVRTNTPVRTESGTLTLENPYYRETDAYGSPLSGSATTPVQTNVAPAETGLPAAVTPPASRGAPDMTSMKASTAGTAPASPEPEVQAPKSMANQAIQPRTIEFDVPPTPSETAPLTLEFAVGSDGQEAIADPVSPTSTVPEPEVTFHGRSDKAGDDASNGANAAQTQTAMVEATLTASREPIVPPVAAPGLVEEVTPALEGYCPVALVANTPPEWKDGKKEFAVRHRGRVYWMSSAEAKKEFLAAPDKATPLASGYDPLILLEEGRLVQGDIRYGLFEEVSGTYMLFASAEAKQRFWDDFDRFSRALDTLVKRARTQN